MTIWERVEAALETLSPAVPFAANVYVVGSGAQLPDLYLVYFLVSSPVEQRADDAETQRSYRVQVTHYSRAGLAGLPDVKTAMVAAGFVTSNKREIPYDRTTRHYGLAEEYVFVEPSS